MFLIGSGAAAAARDSLRTQSMVVVPAFGLVSSVGRSSNRHICGDQIVHGLRLAGVVQELLHDLPEEGRVGAGDLSLGDGGQHIVGSVPGIVLGETPAFESNISLVKYL